MSASCRMSAPWLLILACACEPRWSRLKWSKPSLLHASPVSARSRVQPLAMTPKRTTSALPDETCQTGEGGEGGQGTLHKQFAALRVHAGTGCARQSESHGRSWTGPEGWLLAERPLAGEEGDPKWFFS